VRWMLRRGMTSIPLVLPLVLTACGGSTAGSHARVAVPPSLTVPCRLPAGLPDRPLTQAEVEIHWGQDRDALRRCAGQLAGLAGWAAALSEPQDR
jgi:hypothetical protein